MPGPMDAYQHSAQAKRLRRLSEQADAETRESPIVGARARSQSHRARRRIESGAAAAEGFTAKFSLSAHCN
jgi:hypothetical protein